MGIGLRTEPGSPTEPSTFARWLRERLYASLFVAVLASGTVALGVLALHTPAPARCLEGEYRSAARSSTVQASSGAPPSSTTLEVADAGQTLISLGRALAPARTTIALTTDAMTPGTEINGPIGVRVQSFRNRNGGDVSQAVLAWGTFTSRQTAEIRICVERQGPGDETRYAFYLEPGQFTGAVSILDDRLPATTIPFTLELAHADPFGPLVPIGPVILAGALYLMVLRRPAGGSDPALGDTLLGVRDLDEFLRRPSGIAPIVTGTVAAAGVYTTSYLSNPTWGASGSDLLVLVGAMFTAFVSAGTAFRFVANLDAGDRPAGRATPAADPDPAAPPGADTVGPAARR